jgi:HD-GYP domain-containing protein (c-di-GMP phosphodiesterase class II)
MLVVPLKNYENEVIGVLQLINKIDPFEKVIPFEAEDIEFIESLSSQIAISITTAQLIQKLESMIEGFLNGIIYAIEKKSPYTANHIKRVAELTKMWVDKINNLSFKDLSFNKKEKKLMYLAALMHDVGKLAIPDYILDKSTKLEGLFDRIEVIKERIEKYKLLAENERLKNNISEDEYIKIIKELDETKEFIVEVNKGVEWLDDSKIEKLKLLSKPYIIGTQKIKILLPKEVEILSIRRGTVTDEEKKKIMSHAEISYKILDSIDYPKDYKELPKIAGYHHEKLNGKGYPLGLKGKDIPIPARMLAIIDIFEALTASDRPYKDPNKLSFAMDILYKMAKNNELDFELVEYFYKSGLYLEYAKKFLKPEQIDDVKLEYN